MTNDRASDGRTNLQRYRDMLRHTIDPQFRQTLREMIEELEAVEPETTRLLSGGF